MKYAITVEDIIQIIRNNRQANESWMRECAIRGQWEEYTGHQQRRDKCVEILQEIQDINTLKVQDPTYVVPEMIEKLADEAAQKIALRRDGPRPE